MAHHIDLDELRTEVRDTSQTCTYLRAGRLPSERSKAHLRADDTKFGGWASPRSTWEWRSGTLISDQGLPVSKCCWFKVRREKVIRQAWMEYNVRSAVYGAPCDKYTGTEPSGGTGRTPTGDVDLLGQASATLRTLGLGRDDASHHVQGQTCEHTVLCR